MEKATSKLAPVEDLETERRRQACLKSTRPGMKTIEDVARFLGVSPKNKMKTLAYMAKRSRRENGKIASSVPVVRVPARRPPDE